MLLSSCPAGQLPLGTGHRPVSCRAALSRGSVTCEDSCAARDGAVERGALARAPGCPRVPARPCQRARMGAARRGRVPSRLAQRGPGTAGHRAVQAPCESNGVCLVYMVSVGQNRFCHRGWWGKTEKLKSEVPISNLDWLLVVGLVSGIKWPSGAGQGQTVALPSDGSLVASRAGRQLGPFGTCQLGAQFSKGD